MLDLIQQMLSLFFEFYCTWQDLVGGTWKGLVGVEIAGRLMEFEGNMHLLISLCFFHFLYKFSNR